jgi:UDP-2,3-diacylglucosamine pyrophosphatase LpxH
MTKATESMIPIVQANLSSDLKFAEILPISDLHIGDATMDTRLLTSVIAWVKAKSNRYIVIAGDIFNAALKDSKSDTYKEKYTLKEAMKEFQKVINRFGKDKILAVIRGNHDNRVVRSVSLDPVEICCELEGIPYQGAEAYVNIKIGKPKIQAKTDKSQLSYFMYVAHGVGGGRMMGGTANSLKRHSETVVSDIYIQGHTHKPLIMPGVIYEPNHQRTAIVERQQMYINTCGFVGRDGYAVDYAFPPVSQMFPVIKLSGRKKNIEASMINIGGK